MDEKRYALCNEEEQFFCNVTLSWILHGLQTSSGLRISHWPEVHLRARQYLAIEYDHLDFDRLFEFHKLIRELTKKSVNNGHNHKDAFARLIFSLIALDGVVVENADGRIVDLEKNMIHLNCDMPLIELPMNRKKNRQLKHYYLGDYSLGCMKVLYQRAKKDGSIFPEGWQMTRDHKKKRPRRIYLEAFLQSLWRSVFPDRPVPDYLDVEFWIRSSRLSMVLNGVPFVCLADHRNRIRGAQIPLEQLLADEEEVSNVASQAASDISLDNEHEYTWLKTLHVLVRKSDVSSTGGKVTLGDAGTLRKEFEKSLIDGESNGRCVKDEKVLGRWLIWMMKQKRFQNMRLSTFRGYISAVINRVLPLPDGKSIVKMNANEWKAAIRDLASNEDYMPSSRRTAISHMKVLNEYLHEQGIAPKIDFTDYSFRVSRTTAKCAVIYPHEVDEVINPADNENIKIALIFAFYCGLRCEEVCYLTVKGALDEYRLLVGRSKLFSSRRTFPYGLFVPEEHLDFLKSYIQQRLSDDATWLLIGEEDEPIPTWKLSKQVGRLLKSKDARVQKMHGLRHGFASWQLVRYYMLVDKQFRKDTRVGRLSIDLDGRHPWFEDQMLAQFAEVMGGASWRHSYEEDGHCYGNATDMILISKLLGHASRFTSLENYTNTLGWISRYYLRRREHHITGC
ncbi:tyrosine-type recombinase/integrase [Mariprofundus sp. KV]|uniref:tyrosine-type recombinase/integrase n=1 Tax=Mariprofundus sp. KV TaxID=2608715 RepID=UPI0015A04706|nr:tyrosine-type recombinase/integrase [Mariprofundus sp. KV]